MAVDALRSLPSRQSAVLLAGKGEPYTVAPSWPLPELSGPNEVLIQVQAVGLNPVDWKSADYGFALPTLPAINGRDLAGIVVQVGSDVTSVALGDRVFCASTQYRDYRTSAFQQYAIGYEHCLGKVPAGMSLETCAGIGVGAVTAALALGSALGIRIRNFAPRDLANGAEGEEAEWAAQADEARRLADIFTARFVDYAFDASVSGGDSMSSWRTQMPHYFDNSLSHDQGQVGKWLLIWGAGTTVGYFAAQLAAIAGMRVIAVCSKAKHNVRLRQLNIEHVIDRADPANAVSQILALGTTGGIRLAIDCVGGKSSSFIVQTLDSDQGHCSVVGLTGLPKGAPPRNVSFHAVPVKTFHTNPFVGSQLMQLIEELLREGLLQPPSIEVVNGGLDKVNSSLDRLRKGSVETGRLVVTDIYV